MTADYSSAGSATAIAIFNDLGTGVSYGSYAIATGQATTTILHLPLNDNSLSAIRNSAGNTFSLGGAITDLPDDGHNRYLFAYK